MKPKVKVLQTLLLLFISFNHSSLFLALFDKPIELKTVEFLPCYKTVSDDNSF